MKKNHKIRTRRDIYVLLWDIFRTVFVITFTIMCIYPFYYVVMYSISDQVQATRGVYFWPRGFDLSTYKGLFEKGEIVNAYGITIARTVIGTALHIVGTSILAFLMTR